MRATDVQSVGGQAQSSVRQPCEPTEHGWALPRIFRPLMFPLLSHRRPARVSGHPRALRSSIATTGTPPTRQLTTDTREIELRVLSGHVGVEEVAPPPLTPPPPATPQVPKTDIILDKSLATSSASRTSFLPPRALDWSFFATCVVCRDGTFLLLFRSVCACFVDPAGHFGLNRYVLAEMSRISACSVE